MKVLLNSISIYRPENRPKSETKYRIFFPWGLYGFEKINEYFLFFKETESLFFLQSIYHSKIIFTAVDPFTFFSDFEPYIHIDDITSLEIEKDDDASILCLVNVKNRPLAKINLLGPILINRRTQCAKQLVNISSWV